MDQGGDTYQEGTRQVDEQRRGVLSTLPHLRQPVHPESYTHRLHVHIYIRLQIFIQLSPTLTKLCYTKRDHLAKFLHFTKTLTSKFVY